MISREPLNSRDIDILNRTVARFQKLQLEATLDLEGGADGRAVIWQVDPSKKKAPTYQLQIEKHSAPAGRPEYVIQVGRTNGWTWTIRDMGQVSSAVLLFALNKAEMTMRAA